MSSSAFGFVAAFLGCVLACAFVAAPVQAGLLGSIANFQYYAYGSAYNGYGSPAAFTVDGGAHAQFAKSFNIIVTDTQIIYNYNGNQSTWSPSSVSLNRGGLYIENGSLLSFAGAPTITGVTVNGATTMAGFGGGNVTFNGTEVAVSWTGLSFQSGTQVVLDIIAVPAPGAMAILGVAGLAGRRRRA